MLRILKAIELLPHNKILDGWKRVKRKASQSPNQDVAVVM